MPAFLSSVWQAFPLACVISVAMLLIGAFALVSCRSPNASVARVATFQAAISSANATELRPDSPEEKDAINRVKALLSDLSAENVAATTKNVYAQDAYFNDTLKTLHGADAIEEYFLHTAATVTSISVDFDDVARSGRDYYFRWRMDFQAPKLSRGETIRTIGISQIRFNADGKVVFHQDFWDSAAGLFEHLPVTNQMIHAVRKRL